jgi:hypothetical protein
MLYMNPHTRRDPAPKKQTPRGAHIAFLESASRVVISDFNPISRPPLLEEEEEEEESPLLRDVKQPRLRSAVGDPPIPALLLAMLVHRFPENLPNRGRLFSFRD